MASDQRLGIVLPTPCSVGLASDLPCSRDADVAIWGPISDATGRPRLVVVCVCKQHVAPMRRWLNARALDPGDLDVMSLDMLVHHWGLLVESMGAQPQLLRDRRAA